MSSSSITLSFSLRTSSSVKTVHLIGSWDGYQGQLPLSKDSSKKGSWKGTFRFSSKKLQAGQRYWYYYQMDGYSVSHDPSKEFTVEPTTGRKLNIVDVPASSSGSSKSSSTSRRHSREVPQAAAACEIKCPKPTRPGQTRNIVQEEYTQATLAALTARFGQASLRDEDEESEFEEDSESDYESDCSAPSLTSSRSSRSSNCSTPSSVASDCSCERYGITRSGQKVKLDCGGERCGSDDEEEMFATRRHAVVIR